MFGGYVRLLSVERLKMAKSPVWLLALVSPAIAVLVGLLANPGGNWLLLLAAMLTIHAMLFLPMLTAVFGSLVCRFEHGGGGWKQLMSLPLSRTGLYAAKLTIIMAMVGLTQLLFGGALLGVGAVQGMNGPIPWAVIAQSLLAGWVACLPLAALQLLVSFLWSSFVAPLALNFVFTVPNMLIANSQTYAPYYPWVQPLLAMMPSGGDDFGAFMVPTDTLLMVVLGSFVLFALAGLTIFRYKEI
ncbi:ABC transporter permease [Paenibacillus polymyxa]|uniref:ABC transporter permease n=1 Tax=Paenibacillus polymyxa TaxID=1406 RepID=UPI00307D2A38